MSRSRTILIILAASFILASCSRIPVVNWFFPESGVRWEDTRWCVPASLKRTVAAVSRKFGPVVVTSTKRWWWENKRKGGARKSFHLKCRAVDFIVKSRTSPSKIKRYLRSRSAVGGLSYYRRTGHFHIDDGPKRSW